MKMVRGFTTLQVRLSLNFGCRGTPAFLSLDIRGESKLHFLSGQRISRRAHSEIWTLFLSPFRVSLSPPRIRKWHRCMHPHFP